MTEQLVWIQPDSTELDLADGAAFNLRHHDGFGVGAFEHQITAVPGVHGDQWSSVLFKPRLVTVELQLLAASLSALQDRRASLIAALNPIRGAGTLKLVQTNGAERRLRCVLAEELPLPTRSMPGPKLQNMLLRFRSTGLPFWYDPNQVSVTLESDEAGVFFPFNFPFRLSGSGIFASTTITNNGHVATPVTITINGPGTNPTIRNITTGETLAFSGTTLIAGDQLVIDTTPGAVTVVKNGSAASHLVTTAQFWQLARGTNQIEIDMGGATVDSSVTVAHLVRYLGV